MIEHDLPALIKNETCAVTGHRTLKENFDRKKLDGKFTEIIEKEYKYFLVGMALGFDTECFLSLERLRKKFTDIKIVAVIPCVDQAAKFPPEERKEYNRMLTSADYIAAEKRTYFKNCMLIRNNFLVENSSYLLAYYDGESKKGGTYYTVSRAKKLGVITENIY
ncbi:MAG TPA: hypothetical protein DDW54_03630 [Clostridiales bacterium]|nr:hypothetical protein [Clostridiales bacterium]